MISHQPLSRFRLKPSATDLGRSLMLLLLAGPSLATAGGAIAASPPLDSNRKGRAYEPPPNSRISGGGNTGSGGSRDWCSDDSLAAIAPQFSGVGQSFSTRPTFVWYTDSPTVGVMQFELYQGDLEEPIFSETVLPQSNFVAYTLPATAPALTVGETYWWQATLRCSADTEMVSSWIATSVEIVDSTPTLPAAGAASSSIQMAQAYASSGLWYDALAEVYDPETFDEYLLRQDLLLDLADLEAASGNAIAIDISEQLQDLAEMF
ncbi:MAG: DUF928 domain-containing protein [Cyanobacteria bacterium P01_H01_bin.162]